MWALRVPRQPASWGAGELSNTLVLVYGSHKLEKDYKEGYTPLIWPSLVGQRTQLKSPRLPGQGINPRSLAQQHSVNPHLLWLSVDNPVLPHHRIVRDIEQLFECPTGIDIEFIFPAQGIIRFGGPRSVGILSFLGVDRIRSLLEETTLDTVGNEVADCLYPFDSVVVMVMMVEDAWNSALADVMYGFASDRRMDDPRPREPVPSISVVMKEP